MCMNNYTICLLKPDVMQRNLEYYVAKNIQATGLEIYFRVERRLTRTDVDVLYLESKHQAYYDALVEYLLSGKVIHYFVVGIDALAKLNWLVGCTDPVTAQTHTIRYNIGLSILRNSIHSSNQNRVDAEVMHLYDRPPQELLEELKIHYDN